MSMQSSNNASPSTPQHSGSARAEETREAILVAAEDLFSRDGVDNTTLRAITEQANVNLAAVNYHFRSKDALALAVFDSLSQRVNSRRMNDVQQLIDQAKADGAPPQLTDIIAVFMRPYVNPEPTENSMLLVKLLLQHRLSPNNVTNEIIRRHFNPMATRFIEAIAMATPHVDRTRVYWRYIFMIGTVVMPMTDLIDDNRLLRLSEGKADMRDRATAYKELMDFLVGALSAP